MVRGGRTSTTWTSGGGWRSGETKVIRIPAVLADQVMRCARELDTGNAVLHGNVATNGQEIVLNAIAAYINFKQENYHPNQHSRAIDITTRPWDEMRKFRAMVQNEPVELGLKDE